MPLTIGIDYRFAVSTPRGIGRYTRQLTLELARLDHANRYVLYCHSSPQELFPGNFAIRVIRGTNIAWFEQVVLPWFAVKDRLDVLWCPSNSGPLFLRRKTRLLVTVHDLTFFEEAYRTESFSSHGLGERYRRLALRHGLARIDRLLTVSLYSRARIRQVLKKDSLIVSNCIDEVAPDEDDGVLDRLGIRNRSYVYSMTGEAPHKNLEGLLRLARICSDRWSFVISGVYRSPPANLHVPGNVIFTGKISEDEKNSLYKYASAFVFIPFSEGFGIPLLEAMRYRRPVIASNRTAVPEVLGEGGVLVDPDDLRAIRSVLDSLPWDMTAYTAAQEVQLARYSSCRSEALKLITEFKTRS